MTPSSILSEVTAQGNSKQSSGDESEFTTIEMQKTKIDPVDVINGQYTVHHASKKMDPAMTYSEKVPSLKEKQEDDSSDPDIDDDKDHAFDWDDDNRAAEPTLKRHKTVKRLQGAYNKYCCWHYLSSFMKRVIIALLGSSVFITAGVCTYIYLPHPTEEQLVDPKFKNIRANVQVWMFWAAFMWNIAWIITFLIEAVPFVVYKWVKFFRGRKSEKVKTYMEVSMHGNDVYCVLNTYSFSTGLVSRCILVLRLSLLSIGVHGLS